MESQSQRELEELDQFEQADHQQEHEEKDLIKRRISSHPLYQLLIQAHLECLKVGDKSSSNLERVEKSRILQMQEAMEKHKFSESELDLFMESYCTALGKLKEAIEEPQQKSMAFINNMHSQLRELTVTDEKSTSTSTTMHHEPAASTSSSSTDHL